MERSSKNSIRLATEIKSGKCRTASGIDFDSDSSLKNIFQKNIGESSHTTLL